MKSIKTLLAILAVSGMMFTSCDDLLDPVAVSPTDATELQDDAVQNSKADDAMGGTMEAISTYGISEDWNKKLDGNGPTVDYNATTFVVTLTFPNNGGVIVIDWNKAPGWAVEGLTGVVTITNFIDAGATVSGTLTINSVGTPTQPALSIEGTLTMVMGQQTMTYTVDRTFVWDAGFSMVNIDPTDDVFAIYGTTSVTTANKTMNTTILQNEMVKKANSYLYPYTGVVKMEREGTNKSVTMNYGSDANGAINNAMDSHVKLTIKVGNASMTVVVNLAQ